MATLLMPFRFKAIWRRHRRRPFALLDIGAGNHSASSAKRWFPSCHYTGVDRDRNYNNDERDFVAMDRFIELDVTTLAFDQIPDASYDVILMSHVIEHLPNGDQVIRYLVPKLKPGGMICIEFPGERSLRLPPMKGSLNFHDDPSHVRLFTAGEIAELVRGLGLEVVRAGTRRDLAGILLTPAHALMGWLRYGYVPGGAFWDLLGFADYVEAIRPEGTSPRS